VVVVHIVTATMSVSDSCVRIRYDTVYLTCSKKLMGSQLSIHCTSIFTSYYYLLRMYRVTQKVRPNL